MSPRRTFDRIMLATDIRRSRKLRKHLTPDERWVYVCAIAIAGEAKPRGDFIISGLPVDEADLADEAGVPEKVAASALAKMREIGLLEDLDGVEVVHDFDDYNPAPKEDRTAADRQQRARDRRRDERAVTAASRRDGGRDGDPVTDASREDHGGEVEGEVEVEDVTPNGVTQRERAGVDSSQPPDGLAENAHPRIAPLKAVLDRIHTTKGGIAPTVRSVGLVVATYPGRDHLRHVGDFEHWALSGAAANRSMRDVVQTYRNWVGKEQDSTPGNGVAASRDLWEMADALQAAGARQRGETP